MIFRRRSPADLAKLDARLLYFQQRRPWTFNAATVAIAVVLVLLGSWLAEVIEAMVRGR